MKKIPGILFCISFILMIFSCSGEGRHKEFIERLNDKLPSGTGNIRLEKIEEKDNTLIFHYTILVEGLPLPTEDEVRECKAMNLNMIKTESEWEKFIEDEMAFNFIYSNTAGVKVMDLKIIPDDYK